MNDWAIGYVKHKRIDKSTYWTIFENKIHWLQQRITYFQQKNNWVTFFDVTSICFGIWHSNTESFDKTDTQRRHSLSFLKQSFITSYNIFFLFLVYFYTIIKPKNNDVYYKQFIQCCSEAWQHGRCQNCRPIPIRWVHIQSEGKTYTHQCMCRYRVLEKNVKNAQD